MRIPILKFLKSFIQDVPIETVHSDLNQTLELILKNGQYQLCTENAVYSYGKHYTNFSDSFKRINLSQVHEVLVLGLGLCSIPIILESYKKQKFNFTGIEWDETVIYLASKYIIPQISSYLDVVQADATQFVHYTEEKFDLICIDIFVDDKIPPEALSMEFLQGAADCLNENGILISNHLSVLDSDKSHAQAYYDSIFKSIFPDSTILHIKNNYMLLSDASKIL